MIVNVACNDNAFLIEALKEQNLIDYKGVVFDVDFPEYEIKLYKGRENWFYEIYDMGQLRECIVPKDVPKDVATNMVVLLDSRRMIKELDCDDKYRHCVMGCEDRPDFSECIEDCNKWDRICRDAEKDFESAYESAREHLGSNRIHFIGCILGEQAESPDIDWICAFRW
ncbi:hypothetical protein DRP04_00055 [Archaeoglobales archaeon]|jgi:hypothetical protein|nr:MAG: hypothetical protein DRP04_00055 [Archaeoglobales archaeon]